MNDEERLDLQSAMHQLIEAVRARQSSSVVTCIYTLCELLEMPQPSLALEYPRQPKPEKP